jgi:hypothetical protein
MSRTALVTEGRKHSSETHKSIESNGSWTGAYSNVVCNLRSAWRRISRCRGACRNTRAGRSSEAQEPGGGFLWYVGTVKLFAEETPSLPSSGKVEDTKYCIRRCLGRKGDSYLAGTNKECKVLYAESERQEPNL